MANSKLSNDDSGDKYVRTYDAERFLTEEESSAFDWKKGIRILIVGKTGEGKSATGNTMMGQTWFESDSSGTSVTQKGKAGTIKWKDQHIKIVDTPGLFDNRMSEHDVKLEIIKCMTLVLPGPHIIMYIIRIGRYTKEDIEVADKLLQMLDGNPYKYILIVLTGRDDLDYHKKSPEKYLETVTPAFNRFANKCSQRYIFIDNRSKDEKDEWIKIYSEIDKMVSKNKRSYYTNRLSSKLEHLFGDVVAESIRFDKDVPIEVVIAALEKEIENEGSVLYKLLANASIGGITCGIISGIYGLYVPIVVGGAIVSAGSAAVGSAIVGAGGAAVGVGGSYAYKKICTIS